MDLMEIKHEFDGKKGAFYWDDSGKRLGETTCTMVGTGKLIIDHTEADDSLRGTGKAAELVEAVVAHARANELKIMPLCPFARLIFEKKGAEWADVHF